MTEPERMSELEKQAKEERELSFFGELRLFLRQNKKWWLMPILIVLILFSVLVILAGTGAAPFIYTLH